MATKIQKTFKMFKLKNILNKIKNDKKSKM